MLRCSDQMCIGLWGVYRFLVRSNPGGVVMRTNVEHNSTFDYVRSNRFSYDDAYHDDIVSSITLLG